MILTKEIKIELTKFNYHHYKKIGYDTDNKDFIMVRIEDVGLKSNIKIGEIQMIFRIMLVGNKMGPAVFAIAALIGKEETMRRIEKAVQTFDKKI